MTFSETLLNAPFILTEGAVIERLRRDATMQLHPAILNTSLLYADEGPTLLRRIYREYLHIGYHHNLPMLILTPTWRANPVRLAEAGLPSVDEVSEEAFRLLDQTREGYGQYSRSVFIGGLTGCKGDAYHGFDALGEEEAHRFHGDQVHALAGTGVDFLIASTLPAMTEAKGIARAMAETSLPYLLSFIVRPTGHLLDGTALEEATGEIDRGVRRPPLCYLLNCIHPSVFEEALSHSGARDAGISSRVLGLQANTSPRAPEDLEESSQLECEDPELFAARMLHLNLEFGTRIMGGCCGTDARHIFSLARRVREMIPQTAQSRRKNDPEGKGSKGGRDHGSRA